MKYFLSRIMYKPFLRYYNLLFLFFALTLSLHAQKKDYYQGYIVTIQGDTIHGQVKDRSTGTFPDLHSKIRFKSDDALFRKKYGPDDIQGYGYSGHVFESFPIKEDASFFRFRYFVDEHHDKVFLRLITREAGLSYYHWEYLDQESSYIDHIPLFYRQGNDEMVQVTQGILGLKRKRLMEYFWDCPLLVEAIHSKKLNEITEVYNYYLKHCGGR